MLFSYIEKGCIPRKQKVFEKMNTFFFGQEMLLFTSCLDTKQRACLASDPQPPTPALRKAQDAGSALEALGGAGVDTVNPRHGSGNCRGGDTTGMWGRDGAP